MDILTKIINRKKEEVAERKSLYPLKLLEKSVYFNTKPVSLKKYLLKPDKSGIIAEFKTKSPSKSDINPYANVAEVSIKYMQAGASALSILTDRIFFGGCLEDLTTARRYNYCPILQKDFLIDEYQIIEAKSYGADAILLIAAVLSKTKILDLAKLAQSLQMEVLLEIHNEKEINKLNEFVDLVGVNNRNLKTFQVSINQSIHLSGFIPDDFLKISESGIKTANDIIELKKYGYKGFLMGESFMSTRNPGKACKTLIQQIYQLENNIKNYSQNEVKSLWIE
ncbi:MAG: indole-3-glycerol phosphate synthase TrpC [Bacteroidota bacterium]|nr:indole-3-glycerol phosphate synthase TrpC [Bacteroidota bacterium]